MSASDQAILIIEDDPPTLEMYGRKLAREYRVVACADASEALLMLDSEQVAAVVLELGALDGDGWQLLQQLHASGRNVPIVICSVLDERRRGMQMGATAYLVKPVSPATLLQTVQRALARA